MRLKDKLRKQRAIRRGVQKNKINADRFGDAELNVTHRTSNNLIKKILSLITLLEGATLPNSQQFFPND